MAANQSSVSDSLTFRDILSKFTCLLSIPCRPVRLRPIGSSPSNGGSSSSCGVGLFYVKAVGTANYPVETRRKKSENTGSTRETGGNPEEKGRNHHEVMDCHVCRPLFLCCGWLKNSRSCPGWAGSPPLPGHSHRGPPR